MIDNLYIFYIYLTYIWCIFDINIWYIWHIFDTVIPVYFHWIYSNTFTPTQVTGKISGFTGQVLILDILGLLVIFFDIKSCVLLFHTITTSAPLSGGAAAGLLYQGTFKAKPLKSWFKTMYSEDYENTHWTTDKYCSGPMGNWFVWELKV